MELIDRLNRLFKKSTDDTDDTHSTHSHEDNQRFNSWLAQLMKKYGLNRNDVIKICEMYNDGATYEQMITFAQEVHRISQYYDKNYYSNRYNNDGLER